MIATTRAALLRGGETQDAAGDDVPGETILTGFEDFPASIIEKERREWDPSTNTARTVRKITCRVSTRIPIRTGDRIKDLRTGVVYDLDGDFTRTPRSLSGRASVTLKLKTTTP